MSRIEKALEKASQLRNSVQPVSIARKPQNIPRLQSGNSNARTITIDAGNLLLKALTEPHSPVSEQYRKLKSSLVRLTNEDRFRNMLMVTSAMAGEGKSLTAANLAISMAQEYDLTVLLIDADLRRPSIHGYLGFEQGIGLSDCLQDNIDIGEAIVKTDISKLSLISAGREVAKPLELFASNRMQEMMAEIKHRYKDRYVIIDTPPLLPFAETRSLAQMVDGIVLVIHEGVTARENVAEAQEILKGCPILGVVLNDSTEVTTENSYYNKYYTR
ncbi:MAG: XrtA-associated tyrosine autokinase [Desulfobacteraceae bacterium]|nr:XrtA-associated tyrosine autokinase [Desulfobacteraceae bacterium]